LKSFTYGISTKSLLAVFCNDLKTYPHPFVYTWRGPTPLPYSEQGRQPETTITAIFIVVELHYDCHSANVDIFQVSQIFVSTIFVILRMWSVTCVCLHMTDHPVACYGLVYWISATHSTRLFSHKYYSTKMFSRFKTIFDYRVRGHPAPVPHEFRCNSI
jgi:hypothetical protein